MSCWIINKLFRTMKHNKFILFWNLLFCLSVGSVAFGQSAGEYVNQLADKAMYESRKGSYPKALQYINKAIKIQPKRMDLYYHRAIIIGRSGNYVEAIKEFSRFASHEKFSHAIRLRADCYMAIRMYENAAKDYLSFLKNSPRDGKVWSYLAETFALGGNKKAALGAVQRGLATKSHWSKRLKILQKQILTGKLIVPHKPLTN